MTYAVEHGMLDVSYVQEQIEMDKRKRLLDRHLYSIWEGKDGKWYTYLPDEGKGRVLKKRVTKKAIEDLVVEFYSMQLKVDGIHAREKEKEESRFSSNFEAWKNKQISYGISNNTVQKYECDYRRFFYGTDFEKMDIRDITEEDVTIFIISRIRELGLKEKAGKALWGYISGVFKSARINKKIADDPCKYVDTRAFFKFYNRDSAPSESRILGDDEMERIMDRIKQDHIDKPWYMPSYAVELAAYTGMRAGELAGLKWADVHADERVIVICRSERYDHKQKIYSVSSTKTNKSRRFPITEEILLLFERVRSIQEEYGSQGDFVFSTSDGHVHGRTISDCMRNKCIQIGMEHTKGVHAVRRTVNSKMRCAGVSATVAASLLGHTEEVNNSNYTYDISKMEYKMRVVENMNRELTKKR